MPSDTYKLRTSTFAQNGSVKKDGVVVSLAFGATSDDGIYTVISFSAPLEILRKKFDAWPINFDDVMGTIKNPIEVEVTIATAGSQTAAGNINSMATQPAAAIEQQENENEDTPALESVGKEIQKLTS